MPQNTQDLTTEAGLFCLFKGPPKEGKSIAAHSFPETYTFDFDNKIRAVSNWSKSGTDKKYAANFAYDTFDSLIAVKKKCEEFKTHCPYKTLVTDGITEAANLAMRCMIQYRNPNWQGASLIKSGSDKTIRAGIPMTEIEDFNGESRFLSDLVDDLRVINVKQKVNIIVIAHVIHQEIRDMAGNITYSCKKLITAGNKIGASLPGKFEEVFHFERATSIAPGSEPAFICYTKDRNGNGAGTTLPVQGAIDWTNKNFYDILMKQIRKEI